MERPLSSLAEVSTGITLRGADAAKPSPEGNVCLLRIGDLREDGHIQLDSPPMIKVDPVAANRYRVRPGDVLISAKGSRATAAMYDGPLPVVAGSQFFIVRPDPHLVDPRYLYWFLNLPGTQELLMNAARGSYVQAIPVSAVKEMSITLPPLAAQHRIAHILELRSEEQRLVQQIASKRELLLRHQLQSLATGRIQ